MSYLSSFEIFAVQDSETWTWAPHGIESEEHPFSLLSLQCCRFLCVNLPTWSHRTCRTATPSSQPPLFPLNPWPLLLIINWHDYEAAEPTKNSTLTYTRAAVNKLLQVHPSSRTWWGEGQGILILAYHGRKETISHAMYYPVMFTSWDHRQRTYFTVSPLLPPTLGEGRWPGLERTGGPLPERNQETER